MEDIRIGRKAYGNEVSKDINAGGWILIAGPSDDRISITFFPDPTVKYYVTTKLTDLGSALNINPAIDPVQIDLSMFGRSVCKAWYASSSSGALTISYLESLLVDR